MKRQLSMFEQLRRACTRYGLVPEDIGPPSTFTDLEYMRCYIGHLRGFEAPASFGVSDIHRTRARREWHKLITKVRKNEAGERVRVNRSPNGQAVKSEEQANSQ